MAIVLITFFTSLILLILMIFLITTLKEITNMGAEFDRLVASIAALTDKVTELEDFIANLPTPAASGATPAQLTAFADSVDSDVARIDAAIQPAVV